jgi:hypothetical protein
VTFANAGSVPFSLAAGTLNLFVTLSVNLFCGAGAAGGQCAACLFWEVGWTPTGGQFQRLMGSRWNGMNGNPPPDPNCNNCGTLVQSNCWTGQGAAQTTPTPGQPAQMIVSGSAVNVPVAVIMVPGCPPVPLRGKYGTVTFRANFCLPDANGNCSLAALQNNRLGGTFAEYWQLPLIGQ